MAYDAESDQEQPQGQDTQPGQPGSGQGGTPSPTTTLSGGGGGFAGGAPAGTSGVGPTNANAVGQPSTSGSWTNLNSYINANAGNAPGLGQTLANTVSGQTTQAQNDLGTLSNSFQNQTPFSQINQAASGNDGNLSNFSQYDSGQGSAFTQAQNELNNSFGNTGNANDITAF